eukprot:IDg4383t1
MAPDLHDIPALQRQLENVEGNDGEAHKLRLSSAAPGDSKRLVDLAIAYRRCGDATLRVRALRRGAGRAGRAVRERAQIASLAHAQHLKGLAAATRAGNGPKARVEVQAAAAAAAHSALARALATREKTDLRAACSAVASAARLATRLGPAEASVHDRRAKVHAAAVNLAIALSALGDRERAKAMLEATAVHARAAGDTDNMMRAVANLADEASAVRDLDAARHYAEMWVKHARDTKDEPEEADALRRLGVVLYEQFEVVPARAAFQRAMLLAADAPARDDAQQNLGIVEQAIEEAEHDTVALDALRIRIPVLAAEGKLVEEARTSMDAGNIAFKLRRYANAILHLERYFELADSHDCAPETIGVPKGENCTTIANLAESFWACKRYSEAVEWGTRELVSYGDDRPGQAQAWCNLGNYLSDNGQLEEGIDALKRSIEIAEEVGENGIAENAKLNLEIEMEKLEKERNGQTEPHRPNAAVLRAVDHSIVLERSQFVQMNAPHPVIPDRSDSVVIFSGEPAEKQQSSLWHATSRSLGTHSRGGATSSAVFSTSRPRVAESRSRSNASPAP